MDTLSLQDKFGLTFSATLFDEFNETYHSFKSDLLELDVELQDLIKLKPKSLPQFPELLQIGSKKPSVAYSSQLKSMLWDKLNATFPSHMYNGVRIPGLPNGLSFQEGFSDGNFPVQDFLPLIAVAYGKAKSFADRSAVDFSMETLFAPSFGQGLSTSTLTKLKDKLPGTFNRFSDFDSYTNKFWDPVNKTLFSIEDYLPEIQYAYDLAVSVDFASSKFRPSDLQDAIFPDPRPSVKSFAKFLKKKIMEEIQSSLDGLFDAKLDVPTGGLTAESPSFGGGGFSFGEYSNSSTQVFPPRVDVDAVQGFAFDFDVDVSDSGSLSLVASFVLNVQGVDPAATLSQMISALNGTLQGLGEDFEGLTSSLGNGFDKAAELFEEISNKTELSLDATIDFTVKMDLSYGSFSITSSLNELRASFRAKIGKFHSNMYCNRQQLPI